MKGLFIPGVTAEMFRNGCLEGIEALMAEGEIYDINYDFKERKPCEDAVSRYKVLMLIENSSNDLADSVDNRYLQNEVKKLPPVTPEPRTGKWLINSDGYYPYCSECKAEPKSGEMTDFCPNCGAKMEGFTK